MQIDLDRSLDTFLEQSYRAGETSSFTMELRDRFGNTRNQLTDQQYITLEQISGDTDEATDLSTLANWNPSLDTETGVHTFEFQPTVGGQLRLLLQLPATGETVMQEAPIRAGALNVAASEIGGNGFDSGSVGGGTASFQITARDELGNPVELAPGEVFVVEFQPSVPPVDYTVVDLGDGVYQVRRGTAGVTPREEPARKRECLAATW